MVHALFVGIFEKGSTGLHEGSDMGFRVQGSKEIEGPGGNWHTVPLRFSHRPVAVIASRGLLQQVHLNPKPYTLSPFNEAYVFHLLYHIWYLLQGRCQSTLAHRRLRYPLIGGLATTTKLAWTENRPSLGWPVKVGEHELLARMRKAEAWYENHNLRSGRVGYWSSI